MKYAWKFEVVNRPSKEKDGLTNVSQDFTISGGELVAVGSITKSRGNASYVALNLASDRVGVFETRSKAAHALRKHRVANLTDTKTTETTETTEPVDSGDTPVEAVEPVRTVALDEAPAILGISLGEMMGKIQSGDIKTTENADGAKLVVIEDLGGEAA